MTGGPTPPPLPDQQPPPPPGGGQPAPEPVTHAVREQHHRTRTYPCGTCGGELEFNIGQQQLQCPHCGNVQQFAEVSGEVEEHGLQAAIRDLRQGDLEQAQISGEKEVVCQNCSGHTTFTGSLTSTRCPYCATPIQRDDVHEAPARLAVDGVLPFTVDERQAKDVLEKWVSSRWFAPSEFKRYSTAGSFSSVYTAYFTYDADTRTDYDGERGTRYQVTVGSGENKRTETRTRWNNVSGQVTNTFDDVPVLANTGLEQRHVSKLEPWPTDQVKPFSQEFVAGHLSRTYDRDVEACWADAKSHMEGVITATVRRDIGGDEQKIHRQHTRWSGLRFKHLLLPIWLLTVTYQATTYQVMINGVTGEVAGERPYSKIKIIGLIAVIVAIIVVLVVLFAR